MKKHLTPDTRERIRRLFTDLTKQGEKPADVKRSIIDRFAIDGIEIKPRTIENIIKGAGKKDNILARARINTGMDVQAYQETISNDVEDYDDVLELKDFKVYGSLPLSTPISFPPTFKVDLPIQASEDYEIKPLEKKNLPKEKRVKLTHAKVELFATDIHFPFENKTGWQLFVQSVSEIQPDIIWLNGDVVDMFAASQWDKDPKTAHEFNIQYEFDYTKEKIAELRSLAPNAQIYFKEGNHETRLQRFLNKNAPALRSLKAITVPYNLGLTELNVEWVENNDKYRIGDLWHLHGNEIGGGGANVALAKLRKLLSNCIFGHYHVQQTAIFRKYCGSPIGAWAIASLCDFNQDYVHHADSWTNGFARVEYLPSGLFDVNPVQILTDGDKQICRVDGQWFEQEIIK